VYQEPSPEEIQKQKNRIIQEYLTIALETFPQMITNTISGMISLTLFSILFTTSIKNIFGGSLKQFPVIPFATLVKINLAMHGVIFVKDFLSHPIFWRTEKKIDPEVFTIELGYGMGT
jgi:hypothetical protein